ncbi:hypothetical protein BGZ68_001405, partial [Mortierella alpina]
MQSSVFGGLETLSREMSALEHSSKTFLEDHHPLSTNRFPWSLRTDGPKKRYRITIEELPPLEPGQDEAGSKKDSFFRRLGQHHHQQQETADYDIVGGTKIQELKDDSTMTKDEKGHPEAKKRVVPALVEKVKQ